MELKIQKWGDLNRKSGWNAKKNPRIVETAGFVPLEVRLKRLEENGIRAQFAQDMDLTSEEMRTLYLHPDFEITPYDELEEIEEKLTARQVYLEKLLQQKAAANDSIVDKPVSEAVVEPAAKVKPDSSTDSAQ